MRHRHRKKHLKKVDMTAKVSRSVKKQLCVTMLGLLLSPTVGLAAPKVADTLRKDSVVATEKHSIISLKESNAHVLNIKEPARKKAQSSADKRKNSPKKALPAKEKTVSSKDPSTLDKKSNTSKERVFFTKDKKLQMAAAKEQKLDLKSAKEKNTKGKRGEAPTKKPLPTTKDQAPQSKIAQDTHVHIGENRFTAEQKLNLTLVRESMAIKEDGSVEPLLFYIYTNYPDSLGKYRLSIYEKSDTLLSTPVYQETYAGKMPSSYSPLAWSGKKLDGKLVQIGDAYQIVLEVFSKDGKRRDVTNPVSFTVEKYRKLVEKWEGEHKTYDLKGFGLDNTAKRNITDLYHAIVVQGQGFQGKVLVNGELVETDMWGNFVRELLYPPGEYKIRVEGTKLSGEKFTQEDTVKIQKAGKKEDIFYVGLADITWGRQRVSGTDLHVRNDYHYDKKHYLDGRFAFYVRGTTDDNYRFTAQLDTKEDRLSEAFGNLKKKDPRRIFRELNGKDYYPVFGDDSTVESDVNSEGRFYLKFAKDKKHFLWGNYSTAFMGTEYGAYNRSLYGAQIQRESNSETKHGDVRSFFSAFHAPGTNQYDHNEFPSTGGSLFYLRHARVTEGSEKIYVEIRDKLTGRPLSRQNLVAGADYVLDAFEGRVYLSSPLMMYKPSNTLIDTGMQNGDDVVLIVDYEYYDENLLAKGTGAQGVRGFRWLSDSVRLGTSWVKEKPEYGNDHRMSEVDFIWKPTKGTWLYAEYAHSNEVAHPGFFSTDGGLSFTTLPKVKGKRGSAWKVEQRIDWRDFTEKKVPLTFNFYRRHVDDAFSATGVHQASILAIDPTTNRPEFYAGAVDQVGADLFYQGKDEQESYLLKYARRKDVLTKNYSYNFQASKLFNDSYQGTLELARQEEDYRDRGSSGGLLGAVRILRYVTSDKKEQVYLTQQFALNKHENLPTGGVLSHVINRNKTTLGYVNEIFPHISGRAEIFRGDAGNGGLIGVEGRTGDSRYYTHYRTDLDSTASRTYTWVSGGEHAFNPKLGIYTERQFQSGKIERATSDVYGVRYRPDQLRSFEVDYSRGNVNYSTPSFYNLGKITQRVSHLRYRYEDEISSWYTALERRDQENTDKVRQFVITNYAKKKYPHGVSAVLQFDHSITNGGEKTRTHARYTEATLGAAYRQEKDDRWNLFAKVSYLRGLSAESQRLLLNRSENFDDYEQKSFVYSVEGDYRFNKRYDLAFKAALRKGEMRQHLRDAYGRIGDVGEWQKADARFYALRLNYFVNKRYDAFAEHRWLSVPVSDTSKRGWLLGIYHNLSRQAKIGVGYNFTNYNDDLAHLDYRSRGWFLNIVGEW